MPWKLSSLVLMDLRVDNRFDSTNMLCHSGLEVVGGEFGGVACWDRFWVDPDVLLVGVMTFARAIGEVLRARGDTGACLRLEAEVLPSSTVAAACSSWTPSDGETECHWNLSRRCYPNLCYS